MGDLIASEASRDPQALHVAFNRAVDHANKTFAKAVISPLTITLGDEFQGLLQSLTSGFVLVSNMRLRLLSEGVDCRFVLGAVRIQTPINSDRAWNMMGPGLAQARDQLNDKKNPNAYRFSLLEDPLSEGLMNAIGLTLTDIEMHWTETQRRYVIAQEGDLTRSALAAELGIGERALYKVLKAARLDLYSAQRKALENALLELDVFRGCS